MGVRWMVSMLPYEAVSELSCTVIWLAIGAWNQPF
jgi:hypothetical protein